MGEALRVHSGDPGGTDPLHLRPIIPRHAANFVGEGDFELQVRTTFANLDQVLASYGVKKEQIIQTMVYVKDLRRYFNDIARLHAEYFGEHRPTSTLIGVVDLALPPQLVEIAAIAVVSEQP
jgi:2-iminobutanoate/2-iminopropanoate deaminase